MTRAAPDDQRLRRHLPALPVAVAAEDGAAPFDLLTFLEGRVQAWGVFEDRTGRVRRRFAVELEGRWVAGRLVVEEAFAFDDGATETRSWQLERDGATAFHGTGTDVVGPVEGRNGPGSARMRYRFRLRLGGHPLTVALDDRYHRLDAARALNRATLSKFGVRLGELTIVFERRPDPARAAA